MSFVLGVGVGLVAAFLIYEIKLVASGPVLRTRMTPEIRARIHRMQQVSENSLSTTIAHAIAVYECCLLAKARNATVWIKEEDGTGGEVEIK